MLATAIFQDSSDLATDLQRSLLIIASAANGTTHHSPCNRLCRYWPARLYYLSWQRQIVNRRGIVAPNDAQTQRDRAEAKSTEAIGYAYCANDAEDARTNEQIARTHEPLPGKANRSPKPSGAQREPRFFQKTCRNSYQTPAIHASEEIPSSRRQRKSCEIISSSRCLCRSIRKFAGREDQRHCVQS